MKTKSGIDYECRPLTWGERKQITRQMAKSSTDSGSVIDYLYDTVEFGLTEINGKKATMELMAKELDNNDVREIAFEIIEISNFNKKKVKNQA